jgi:DNA recombination protein RmuC
MEYIIIFLLLAILAGIGAALYFLSTKKNSGENEKIIQMMERLSNLSEQNKDLRQALDEKLSEVHKTTQDQFGKTTGIMQGITQQANKIIFEVSEKLSELEETNKQVINFSSQLQNLQDILKNPKQRGVLGEYFLEETLKNVLPPNSYQMQYAFKNNDHSRCGGICQRQSYSD